MALAARAVRQQLAQNPEADLADLLAKAAVGAASVGGAIGPIYAIALARTAAMVRTLDVGSDEPTIGQIRACAEAATEGIIGLGGAKPGDKTVVDAIVPMVEALRTAENEGATVPSALNSAVEAARRGADSTQDMIAALGRASRLGERSRGWADPGATSFVLAVDAVVRCYLGPADAETT